MKACNENPEYYNVNPYWSVVLEGLSLDTPVQITPVQGQLAEILSNNIEEAYFGVKSAADALNDAHEEMQKLLDEFWAGIRRRKYVDVNPTPKPPPRSCQGGGS